MASTDVAKTKSNKVQITKNRMSPPYNDLSKLNIYWAEEFILNRLGGPSFPPSGFDSDTV
jgi:hypothetical protein